MHLDITIWGWTLGAITGKIVAGVLANEKTNLDLSPIAQQDLVKKTPSGRIKVNKSRKTLGCILVKKSVYLSDSFVIDSF